MKRKRETCHALEFAKQAWTDKPWIHDLKACDEAFAKSAERMEKAGRTEVAGEMKHVSRVMFTVNRWLQAKQCYTITEALADDLFAMDDLTFPMDAMHLPFPCFYLDMEPFGEDFPNSPGARLLGYYVLLDEVPYGDGVTACCCSIVVLALGAGGEYVYGGTAFDYAPEYMEDDLNGTVRKLTQNLPEQKKHITRALLFAAYLSSEKPEVMENEAQKQFYRLSAKPKNSSMRKWDVGVRYMLEKQRHAQGPAPGTDDEPGMPGDGAKTAGGKPKRNPPRPHMRKAHWQAYRTGRGRTGKKVLWIPPTMVAMPKDSKNEEVPAVIRERKEKKSNEKEA